MKLTYIEPRLPADPRGFGGKIQCKYESCEDVEMRLSCEVELVYSLAVSSGGMSSRSSRSRAAITLGKKPGPAGSGREEVYLIVSTTNNVAGSKYKAG